MIRVRRNRRRVYFKSEIDAAERDNESVNAVLPISLNKCFAVPEGSPV